MSDKIDITITATLRYCEEEYKMNNRKQLDMWTHLEQCERLQKRFGNYNQFKIQPNKKNKIPILNIVNNLLDKHNKSLTLLDVGCGSGHFLWAFKDKVSKLIGLDYSLYMIKLIKKQMQKTNVPSKFFVGSCWNIPLDNNCVDISLQVDVCMHIGGSWDSIKEMIRVSKKYIIFTGPSFEKSDKQMDRLMWGKSWAISIPLLSKKLDRLIDQRTIIRYKYEHRPKTNTYHHRILVIEK